VPPGRLEDLEGADDVGLDERARLGEGVVVVGLRGEVDDRVAGGHQSVDQRAVGDVAHDQLDSVARQAFERLAGGGVRQLVEHGDPHAGLPHEVMDEVGADEPGSAGH
jgi:hypothetical protein